MNQRDRDTYVILSCVMSIAFGGFYVWYDGDVGYGLVFRIMAIPLVVLPLIVLKLYFKKAVIQSTTSVNHEGKQ